MQVTLRRRPEHGGYGHGEGVLDGPAVYLHAETGESVGLDGAGGLDLGLDDDGTFGKTHDNVRPATLAKRLGNRLKTNSLREQP